VIAICPECRQGKHDNCDGTAYDIEADALVRCLCVDSPHLAAGQPASVDNPETP
jgi:hypothetical protein